MDVERREALEFRVTPDGRGLSGTALRYGDTARLADGRRERFQAGAFEDLPTASLNLQHSSTSVSGPIIWSDGPHSLEFRADLVEEGVRNLVRRGAVSGVSIEFRSLDEATEHGERIIRRAELRGLAIVDSPAYPGSRVELRAREGRRGRLAAWL